MSQLRGLSVTLLALVLAPALLAQSASDRWLREDYTAPGAKPPVQVPDGNPRLTAEVTGGVFRLVDGGAEQGDLLTCDQLATSASYRPGWFAINSGGFLARSDTAGKESTKVAIPELDT